jgi:hypothetical protein
MSVMATRRTISLLSIEGYSEKHNVITDPAMTEREKMCISEGC